LVCLVAFRASTTRGTDLCLDLTVRDVTLQTYVNKGFQHRVVLNFTRRTAGRLLPVAFTELSSVNNALIERQVACDKQIT